MPLTTKIQLITLLITSCILFYWFLFSTSQSHITDQCNKYRYSFTNLNRPTRKEDAHVLILTPFKQSAHLVDTYFDNLLKLTYPHHLISLGFLVSDSTDGTFEKLQSRAQQTLPEWQRFNKITVLQKDYKYDLPTNEDRHKFEVQIQRRAIMAKSRNTLLSTTLSEEHDWVLWLDGDVVEYPETLLDELISLDKDVIAPNCWWHSYNEKGGYDKNNWQETNESIEFQKTIPHDQVLVEGYEGVLNTHRKLMIDMVNEGGNTDMYHTIPLDAVGGTCTFVRAQVHRDGAIFPPFAYQHQVETEGFAKIAKSLGYSIWGLPNYFVYHYI
ncbi:Golgi mannosyltransferase complex subunit [Rhizopus azygosporus]|uniref:Golgi mannosyltransferase complex subunit n=1 Tax=Rhizopus azygosporus TaxID=86630 RepID=A0A367JFZ5_RHIAZ|nr:Golgi mannosyltransferase complex subunit [Rhizopus azygosporus]